MSYHPVSGLGQLTMSPSTQAALTACSNQCEAQYGVSSGHPDVLQLSLCFANCNVQYPPTVTTPAGPVTPGVTPLPLPSLPSLTLPPSPVPAPTPAPLPAPAPAPAKLSTASMLVTGGVIAGVGVLGYFVAKKKGWIK